MICEAYILSVTDGTDEKDSMAMLVRCVCGWEARVTDTSRSSMLCPGCGTVLSLHPKDEARDWLPGREYHAAAVRRAAPLTKSIASIWFVEDAEGGPARPDASRIVFSFTLIVAVASLLIWGLYFGGFGRTNTLQVGETYHLNRSGFYRALKNEAVFDELRKAEASDDSERVSSLVRNGDVISIDERSALRLLSQGPDLSWFAIEAGPGSGMSVFVETQMVRPGSPAGR